MNFPENLKYTKDHEWIRVEGNEAFVGITAFAQGELGDIVFVDIATEGETLAREAVFGTVEAVKTVSDLFLPISGKILEVNKQLDGAADLSKSTLNESDISAIIQNGKGSMPGFGSLTDEEKSAISLYVKSLAGTQQ